MKTNLLHLKKTVATLVILLATFTGAQADNWSGYMYVTTNQTFSQDIVLLNSTTLLISPGVTATISGNISNSGGSYSITVESGGKLLLTGNNTYTGHTIVNNGTVQVGNGVSGNISGSSGVELNSPTTVLRFEPGAAMTFDKVISGTGSVQYAGNSTKSLRLLADNTYTGTTTVEAGGYLWLGYLTAAGSVGGNINLDGSCLNFYRSNDYTYPGIISGAGEVKKYGSAKVILTGVNTYTGETTVGAGTLQVGDGANGSINSTSDVSLYDAGTVLRFEPGADMLFTKVISGPGSVQYKGGGKLTLALNNTYTGTTTINGGVLQIGNNRNAGSVAGNIITDNASERIEFTRSDDFTYSGVISGPGNVIKNNTNKVTFTGANTYTGMTLVADGTLQIGNGTNGSISGNSSVELVKKTSVLRFEPGADIVYSAVISGAGSVQYKGGGRLTLAANNTYEGTTTVNGGVLQIGNNGTSGSVAGDIITDNASEWIDIKRSDDFTYSKVISGPGCVNKYNTNKVTFTGVNIYTGKTVVTDGTLQIGDGTNGSINSTSTVELTNTTSILRFEPGGNIVFDKSISGSGSVQYKGSSGKNLTLTANNTYGNGTTIEAGDFWVGDAGSTGSVTGKITVNTDGRFCIDHSNGYTCSNVVSGAGGIYLMTYTGATVTLSGANTYTGQTLIAGTGTMALNATGVIASSSGVSFSGSAKLDVSAGDKTIQSLSGTYSNAEVILGSRTLTIGTGGQNNGGGLYYGIFSGTGNVNKQGTGVFTMNSANNTASGIFTQTEGTVRFSKWAGNFTKGASGSLEIIGNASVGGNLILGGGSIVMNLTTATPSKLTVTGSVSAYPTNTLDIVAPFATADYVLMQAASGITDITPYKLSLTGVAAGTLSVNTPIQLKLSTSTTTTGLEDVALPAMRIYPNPCTTTVMIENAEGANLNVMDMAGRLVLSQDKLSDSQEIPVGNLNTGTYLFRLTKDGLKKTVIVLKK